MEGIQVSVEKAGYQGDISIIKVGGYIDTTTSSELERALDSLLKAGIFRIIIDLGNVDYISSAGWGIFISEIKGIRERSGDLKLAKMIPDVYEVFELLEFHYILKAYDTVEQAIQDFDKEGGVSTFIEDSDEEEPEPVLDDEPVLTDLPEEMTGNEVEDKVREIALANPDWNAGQIAKALSSDESTIRVGKLTVWKMLRKMNLSSRNDRERALRSS
ncbi:STAS domain-containing protein [bacterium]|nr:STAS domain-containing protein [bacterium]